MSEYARIPMQFVGPLKVSGPVIEGDFEVPLATYEAPLWPSVNRGARVSTQCAGGIQCTVIDERMTRSVLFEAPDATTALKALNNIKDGFTALCKIVETTSRYAKLLDLHSQIAGNLLFIRFEFSTGDAAGHNMCTQAAEALMTHILEYHAELEYVSISGNYCSDKKATAVNGILGRGKYVVAELTIPKRICRRYLKAEPEDIVQLNIRKNLVGTMLAGGSRSANAHFANMLLGFYLATGQDAANIIEGSQGLTLAEQRKGDLYFSVTVPNLIVGTVGSGKEMDFVTENFERMGLTQARETGENARRLACLCAATVLCGELSLLAAQTNPGELMEAHRRIERRQRE
jgi:hydroxymethylglutaryl-CoA reductase (NADPH)